MAFKRILVAYDGSPSSVGACKIGASFARGFGSEVTVLNVIRPSGSVRVPLTDERYTGSIKGANKLVDEAISLIARKGVTVRGKILLADDSIARVIVEYESDMKSDLTILGTRGMSEFKKLLLGSVSSYVLTHARGSVLITRLAQQDAEEIRFKSIIVAVDGSESALRATELATQTAKTFGAKLTVLHVICIPSSLYLGGSSISFIDMERKARREAESAVLAAATIAEKNDVTVGKSIVQDFDSPDRGINKYAKENKVDLVVIGTRGMSSLKKLLVGSVASEVATSTPCSVLVTK